VVLLRPDILHFVLSLKHNMSISTEGDGYVSEAASLDGYDGYDPELDRISAPPVPGSHPIDRAKLETWKENALRLAGNERETKRIRDFARDVRHISFEEFKAALASCFYTLNIYFPEDEYEYELTNKGEYINQEKGNSEPWLKALVVHEGLYTPPPPKVSFLNGRERRAYKAMREETLGRRFGKLRLFVEDATYCGQT
jgi:hypothetical protein